MNGQELPRRLMLPLAGCVLLYGVWAANARPVGAEELVKTGYEALWYSRADSATQPLLDALERDPGSPERWTDIAEALFATGRNDDARYCEEQALLRAPRLPHIATRAAGMYFRMGDAAAGLELSRRALDDSHDYAPAVFQLWQRAGGSAEEVYRFAVRENAKVGREYFSFLAGTGDIGATDAAWRILQTEHMASESEFRNYAAALTNAKDYERASAIEGGFLAAGVADGGFESDWTDTEPTWRLEPFSGVRVARDGNVKHSGQASVRIEFDGSNQGEVNPVRQTRALGAGVWMLRGVVRTELQGPGFTSGPAATSGIGLRLVEAGSGRVLAQTPYLNVTRDWTPLEARAVVSPAAQLVRIEVVRPASPESALRMTGTAWLDDVTLVREASK